MFYWFIGGALVLIILIDFLGTRFIKPKKEDTPPEDENLNEDN